jgi:hypothetical protein
MRLIEALCALPCTGKIQGVAAMAAARKAKGGNGQRFGQTFGFVKEQKST